MLKRNQKNLVYLAIFLLPIFLFFFSPNLYVRLKSNVVDITSPAIRLLSFPLLEIKKLLYYHRTYGEYKRLNQEVAVLKSRLIGLEEVIQENSRLENLLEFKRRLLYASVAANVIGRNPSFWNSSMIIDKGKSDGIKQGQAVVNAFGVVGKVAEVGSRMSKVILLTDPQFGVAALVQGSRETGLVVGSLQGDVCRLRYIDKDAHIEIGDKVITSRMSASFPENILIGEVLSQDTDSTEAFNEYLIRPSVSLSRIEEVLVILK